VIVALYSVGRHDDDNRWGPLGVGAAVVALTIDGVLLSTPWEDIGFGYAFMFGAWYLGRRLRLRAERAPGSARSRPPRHGGSSPRSAPT
jgi:hypothetical protein